MNVNGYFALGFAYLITNTCLYICHATTHLVLKWKKKKNQYILAKRFSSRFLHPGFDIEFRSWAELCALCVLVAEGLVLEFVMKRGTLVCAWPTELHIMDVSTVVRLHVSVTALSLSFSLRRSAARRVRLESLSAFCSGTANALWTPQI